jgi:hypothetical protein
VFIARTVPVQSGREPREATPPAAMTKMASQRVQNAGTEAMNNGRKGSGQALPDVRSLQQTVQSGCFGRRQQLKAIAATVR